MTRMNMHDADARHSAMCVPWHAARLFYPGLFGRVALPASLRFSHPVTAAISGGYSTRPLMRGS
jgi:hypothetical protein